MTTTHAPATRTFAVITWKNLPRQYDDHSAMGTWATCGHDDDACPRITAEVFVREGSVVDGGQEAEHWDGELTVLDPLICKVCAR